MLLQQAELNTGRTLEAALAQAERAVLVIGCGRNGFIPRGFDPDTDVLVNMDPQLEVESDDVAYFAIRGGYDHATRSLPFPTASVHSVRADAIAAYIMSYPLDPADTSPESAAVFEEIRGLDDIYCRPELCELRRGRVHERTTSTLLARMYVLADGRTVTHQTNKSTGSIQWRVVDPSHICDWSRELARILKPGGTFSTHDFVGSGGYASHDQCRTALIDAGFTPGNARVIRGPQETDSQTIKDNFIEGNYGQPFSLSARVFS